MCVKLTLRTSFIRPASRFRTIFYINPNLPSRPFALSLFHIIGNRTHHPTKCGLHSVDEAEADCARQLCPHNSCREHNYCGNVRRSLYFFCVTMGLMWMFGVILQSIEAPVEIADNIQYVSFMAEIRGNLSATAYTTLVGHLGRDPIRGSENWVDYNDNANNEKENAGWETRGLSASNAAFFVFTMAATIGYGDFAPVTDSGKWISILAIIITIPMTMLMYIKMARVLFQGLMRVFMHFNNEISIAFQSCDKR